MTFHDKRLMAANRSVNRFRRRRLLQQGAGTINLWSAMPSIEMGDIADDWNAVGADLRRALTVYADERG
ncbi:hypothetical protein GCM10023219_09670 [Stakelama sediminis]